MDGVFHVAGGQDDLAWTDQVHNDDGDDVNSNCDNDHNNDDDGFLDWDHDY